MWKKSSSTMSTECTGLRRLMASTPLAVITRAQ